jgi:hypothetical protein
LRVLTWSRVAAIVDVTVMVGVGLELTDSLVAVIVAVPAPTAVTVVAPVVPEAGFTVSTAVLLETQLTVRPVSVWLLASLSVAVSCCVPPSSIGVVGAETVTVATGAGLTVMVAVGLELTDSLVAVIVAVPTPTPVTVAGEPLALTVSTDVLLESQVIARPVRTLPLASLVTAVSC